MSTPKRFILVGDDQVPVSPQDVLRQVQERGIKTSALFYGVSESTLRKFMRANRIITQRSSTFVQLPESTPITMEIPQVPVPAGSGGFRLDRKVRSSSGG